MNHLASKLTAGIIVALLTYTSGAAADGKNRYPRSMTRANTAPESKCLITRASERKRSAGALRRGKPWAMHEKSSVAVSEEESDEKPAIERKGLLVSPRGDWHKVV